MRCTNEEASRGLLFHSLCHVMIKRPPVSTAVTLSAFTTLNSLNFFFFTLTAKDVITYAEVTERVILLLVTLMKRYSGDMS